MTLSPAVVDLTLAKLFPPADPYINDPVGFCREVLGFEPWSKQRDILESVRDNQKTVVRACHGVGKTRTAAEVALWFLVTHGPSCRVISTAPTWSQVRDHLWRAIRESVAQAHHAGRLKHVPPPNQTDLELGHQWFAIGQSTDQPERFQGHHADHLLLIVDEASGVDEKIYEAAEGFLTAEGAKVLLIGNPTKIGGTFYKAFTKDAKHWSRIHISAVDAPNETDEVVPAAVARALPRKGWVDEKRDQWGEDSAIFQIRALGNFAKNADSVVMPLGDVEDAQARTIEIDESVEHCVISCDVARYGDDETVIVERVGQRVRIVETYVGKPTTHTTARILHHASRFEQHVVTIVVDDSGVGGGVSDQVRAAGYQCVAFLGAHVARRPRDFPNRRSEVWFEAQAMLEDIDLDGDEQLAADLTAPEYSYDLKQRRVVESKDVTKRRLGRSPDRADAVCMALSMPMQTGEGMAELQRLRDLPRRKPITAGLRTRKM